jgi:hypothetical protein
MKYPPDGEARRLFDRACAASEQVFGVNRAALIGPARPRHLADVRMLVMAFLAMDIVQERLAALFNRTHGCVGHSVHMRATLLAQHASLAEKYARFVELAAHTPPTPKHPGVAAEELLREIVSARGADRDMALSRAASFLAGRTSVPSASSVVKKSTIPNP